MPTASDTRTETIDVINLAVYLQRHGIRVIATSVSWGMDTFDGKPNGKLDVTLNTARTQPIEDADHREMW